MMKNSKNVWVKGVAPNNTRPFTPQNKTICPRDKNISNLLFVFLLYINLMGTKLGL